MSRQPSTQLEQDIGQDFSSSKVYAKGVWGPTSKSLLRHDARRRTCVAEVYLLAHRGLRLALIDDDINIIVPRGRPSLHSPGPYFTPVGRVSSCPGLERDFYEAL